MFRNIGNPALKHILAFCLVLTLNSCVPFNRLLNLENRVDILEKRIIVLERQKFRALADMKEEISLLKKRAALNVGNLKKVRRHYKEELAGIKKELELMASGGELSRRKLKNAAAGIASLNKRLGDQEIAVNELRTFFKSGADNYSSASAYERRAAFEKALRLYKAKRFKKAEKEFDDFRSKYPNSDLTDDCLFFIAYINFLRGNHAEASLRFFEMLEQFPQSNRLDEAKWWLAVALERSGDLNGALDAYKRLVKTGEKNRFGKKARARLNQLESVNLPK